MGRGVYLVYVGAGAETAPAASLRALAGVGAAPSRTTAAPPGGSGSGGVVCIPPSVPVELQRLLDTGGARLREVLPAQAEALVREDGLLVAVAGPRGPELARALLGAADAARVEVRTTPPQPLFDDCLVGQELVSLQRITRILREQCPWDRVQTGRDIVSYSLEEVYELADAIAEDDLADEHGELGDVLFQVYFLSLLLAERGGGDLGSVAAGIERKLIRRHPHIFAAAVADTPAAVRDRWERIKREQEGREGVFHDVPPTLPALLYARKLQRRAAEVGFDWDTALQAFHKIAEEHAELAEALAPYGQAREFDAEDGADDAHAARDEAAGLGPAVGQVPQAPEPPTSPPSPEMRHDPRLHHEFGDLLFAVVNVARKAGIDPELALREASRRFERRVHAAAELARAEGVDWSAVGLAEQERYYQRAKRAEGDEKR